MYKKAYILRNCLVGSPFKTLMVLSPSYYEGFFIPKIKKGPRLGSLLTVKVKEVR